MLLCHVINLLFHICTYHIYAHECTWMQTKACIRLSFPFPHSPAKIEVAVTRTHYTQRQKKQNEIEHCHTIVFYFHRCCIRWCRRACNAVWNGHGETNKCIVWKKQHRPRHVPGVYAAEIIQFNRRSRLINNIWWTASLWIQPRLFWSSASTFWFVKSFDRLWKWRAVRSNPQKLFSSL